MSTAVIPRGQDVIWFHSQFVDRPLIRRLLKLTVTERFDRNVAVGRHVAQMERIQRAILTGSLTAHH